MPRRNDDAVGWESCDEDELDQFHPPSKRAKRTRQGDISHSNSDPEESYDAVDIYSLPAGTTLSKDQLLRLSTADFDAYVANLQNERPLHGDEKSEFKAIRRRIRNRESARESRSNKKEYSDTLQARVDTLSSHNRLLGNRITAMQSENQTLKDEVLYLQDMIKKTPSLEQLFNTIVMLSANQGGALPLAPLP